MSTESQITVLQIISGFAVEGPLGGIERFGMSLSKSLMELSVTPILCGLWAYDTPFEYQWVDSMRQLGIQAFIAADWDEQAPYKSFRLAFQGIRNSDIPKVDIIHSHCQFGDVVALLLKRSLGARRLIRTVHNEKEWGKRPLRSLLLRNLAYPLLFDAELGVAQQVVNKLDRRPLSRLINHRARLFHNALEIERFAAPVKQPAEMRRSLGLEPDAAVVGSIGRLVEQKGHKYLLQAIPQVLKVLPHARFLIIGDGELREELAKEALDLGIMPEVIFTGSRKDVVDLLNIMDLFVNPSLWEGLPTVVLESMAAQVPVLATIVSGTVEQIRPDISGKLVPPGNPEALASGIIEMLELTSEQKRSMTENALQTVVNSFSIKAVANQHWELYTYLLAN
jgi:glycosyltransferase involved in cell wall biosynthesis